MTSEPIRVLLAEDSVIFASVIIDLLVQASDIKLVKHVDNGEDAVRQCEELKPDLVLMDVQMPRLDGLSATEAIMASCPTPILIITSDPFRGGVDVSFKALSAGALDLYPKSSLSPGQPKNGADLLKKIRLLAQIPVIRHVRGHRAVIREKPRFSESARASTRPSPGMNHPLIGIVASTGGPRALATMLHDLPADLPASLLVVQHITHGFTSHLARWLDGNSPMKVREALDRDVPRPGEVLIAPGGTHMELNAKHSLRLRKPTSTRGHCPGGDELLHSMAQHAHARSLGMILSGMGGDGAQGLLAMYEAGCTTVAQDRESCVVWGMPGAACELRAVQHIFTPAHMVAFLMDYCHLAQRKGR
jgi:two-component system chemotaxis response regulator CheB